VRLKKYACVLCGRKFDRPSSRETHFLTHTGEKPYECPQCGMRFTTPSNVNRHLRTLRHSRSPSSSGRDSSSDSASLGEGLSPPLLEDTSFADPQTAATHRMPSRLTQLVPISSNLTDWNHVDGRQTATAAAAFASHAHLPHSSVVGELPDNNTPELPTQATWVTYFPSSSSLPSYQNCAGIMSYLAPDPSSSISHGSADDVGARPHTPAAHLENDHSVYDHNQQE